MITYKKRLLTSVTFFSLTVSPLVASEASEDWMTQATMGFSSSDANSEEDKPSIEWGKQAMINSNEIDAFYSAQVKMGSYSSDANSEEDKPSIKWGTESVINFIPRYEYLMAETTMGSSSSDANLEKDESSSEWDMMTPCRGYNSGDELTPDLIAFWEGDKNILAQSSPVKDISPTLKDKKDDSLEQNDYDAIKKHRDVLAYSMMESSLGDDFDFDTPEIATNGETDLEKYERMKLIAKQPFPTIKAGRKLSHNDIAKRKEIDQAKAFVNLYQKEEFIKKTNEKFNKNQKAFIEDTTNAKYSFANNIANAAKKFGEKDLSLSGSVWE